MSEINNDGISGAWQVSPRFVSADLQRAAAANRLAVGGADCQQLLAEMVEVFGRQDDGAKGERPGGSPLRQPSVPFGRALEVVKSVLPQLQQMPLSRLAENASAIEQRRAAEAHDRETHVSGYAAAVGELETEVEGFGRMLERYAKLDAHGKTADDEIARVQTARVRAFDAFEAADEAARQPRVGAPDAMQREVSALETLLLLFSKFSEMLSERAESRIEHESAQIDIARKERLQKMLDEMDRVEKENAKAEELNKTAGCVGKIIGAVVTAVATIGAVFTGGASLAVAGIGLALMAADSIVQAATGKSFMEELFKPVMAVLQPVLEFLSDKLSDVLQALGVGEEIAKMIAMVTVAVAMVGAIAAVSLSGAGSLVAKGAGKVASLLAKGVERTLGKLVPEALKQAASQGGRRLASGASNMVEAAMERLGMKSDAISRQMYGHRMQQMAAGGAVVHVAATGGLNIAAGVHGVEAAKGEAKVKVLENETELLERLMQALLDAVARSAEQANAVFAAISRVVQTHTDANVAVTRMIAGSRVV
ncbi:type III secretion system translocon subunit SctE [Burkholderia dolosa]|uniref:type III secretion system translocon subunit SctE n=1 Tax=Burkholderia dolosa TaxID=152500 RepID=UPI001B9F6B64|nr:type III secretion system translocon subunit SctE [Burkholderia dolosa]MBR8313153.1 type III secretion system translocon subunit SctE [Burkholderia dolosa]